MIPSSKCYKQFIFIHYTYDTLYACFVTHHKVHIHIKCILELAYQRSSVRTTQF